MAGAGAMEWGGWDCQDGVPFSRQSTQGKTKLNFEAEVQAPTEVRPGAPPTASHLPPVVAVTLNDRRRQARGRWCAPVRVRSTSCFSSTCRAGGERTSSPDVDVDDGAVYHGDGRRTGAAAGGVGWVVMDKQRRRQRAMNRRTRTRRESAR